MMRWLGYTLLLLLIIVALSIGLVAFILYTPTGTQWALDVAIPRVPGVLQIETQQGALGRNLILNKIQYQAPAAQDSAGGLRVSIGSLELKFDPSALWFDGKLHISRLFIDNIRVHLPDSSGSESSPFEFKLPPLPIRIRLDEINITDTQIVTYDPSLIPDLKGRLAWNSNELALSNLQVSSPDYQVSGSIAVAGTQIPQLRGSLKFRWPEHALDGSLQLTGTVIEPLLAVGLSNPLAAQIDLRLKLVDPSTPQFNARIQVPLLEQPDWQLNDAMIEVQGTLDDYQFQGSAGLYHEQFTDGHLSLAGSGNLHQVTLSSFQLNNDSHTLKGTASVDWQSKLRFSLSASAGTNTLETDGYLEQGWPVLNLQFRGQDLSQLLPGLTGDLHLQGASSGSLTAPVIKLQIASDNLNWESMRINQLRSEIDFQNNQANLVLQLADTQLSNEIQLSALNWSMQIDRLLQPGQLRLNEKKPHWTGKLSAAKFLGGVELDNLLMEIQGDPARQQISLNYDLSQQAGHIDAVILHSGFDVDNLDITLAESTLLTVPGLQLKSDGKVRIQWQAGSATLYPHCWRANLGELCLEKAHWSAQKWASSGHLSLTDPQSLIQQFVPDWQVNATITGLWNLHAEDAIGGAAELKITGGKVQRLSEAGPLTLADAITGDLALTFRDTLAEARLKLTADGGHQLQLEATSAGFNADSLLSGTAQLQVTDLNLIENWVDGLDDVAGELKAQGRLSGTWNAPHLTTELQLNDGIGHWQNPYLAFTDLDINATLDDAQNLQVDVTGKLEKSGNIALQAQGSAMLSNLRQLDARITGEHIQLRQDKIELELAPDLTVHSDAKAHRIKGSLAISNASVKLQSLPESAVSRSPDVIIVGAEQPAVATVPVEADIKIRLGDKIRFTAFGLNTGLKGDLRLRSVPTRPPRLTGRVDLADGIFSAFGQELTIKQGNLTFTGPMDNPLVDLRAIRSIKGDETIEVGVHVQGPALELRSTLFSTPTMSDADVLSYLLLGRKLNSDSSTEGNQLATAAIGLGLKTAAPVIESLRQNVGLDELGAEGAEGGDVAFVAGKRISSKLYVRYTYRAFSQFGALLLEYTLSPRWRLEASASQQPAIDLLYKVGGD